MKRVVLLSAVAMSVVLGGCGVSRDSGVPGKDVPFEEGKNYYVNNEVADTLSVVKISTEDEFRRLFGMASTMSRRGRPTEIDWTKEFVIAMIAEPTDYEESVSARSLRIDKGLLRVCFLEERGARKRNYTIRPYSLLIIDRRYDYPFDWRVEVQPSKPYRYIVYCKDEKSRSSLVKYAKKRGDNVTYEYTTVNAVAVSVNSCDSPAEAECVYGARKGVVGVHMDGVNSLQKQQ